MYLSPFSDFKRWKSSTVKRILMYSTGAQLINAILFPFHLVFSCLLVITLTIPYPMELWWHLDKELLGSIICVRYFLLEKWGYWKRQPIPYVWIWRHRTLDEVKQYLWVKRRNWLGKLIEGRKCLDFKLKWPFCNVLCILTPFKARHVFPSPSCFKWRMKFYRIEKIYFPVQLSFSEDSTEEFCF